METPGKNKASELPGVHPRRHGVVGGGGAFVALVTPAHLWGCHGPASTVTTTTKQQQQQRGDLYEILAIEAQTF